MHGVKMYPIHPSVRSGVVAREQMINLTALSKSARREKPRPDDVAVYNLAWRCIKRNNPALAQLLEDPFLKELVCTFNAEIMVPVNMGGVL